MFRYYDDWESFQYQYYTSTKLFDERTMELRARRDRFHDK